MDIEKKSSPAEAGLQNTFVLLLQTRSGTTALAQRLSCWLQIHVCPVWTQWHILEHGNGCRTCSCRLLSNLVGKRDILKIDTQDWGQKSTDFCSCVVICPTETWRKPKCQSNHGIVHICRNAKWLCRSPADLPVCTVWHSRERKIWACQGHQAVLRK